ncbi:GAF domain-containing protein [Rufibacter psychrotolerans]|uniref:GAF domain-containing protein n=1 Tax=Rufibacter psychrotolerans TaxID=2812556 RepID=UPI00196896CA|nr:GAF domain-containing protein [Rufibacter sp. SYSU D00308]
MLETWNPRLEVAWSTDDIQVLDAAVLLSQQSEQAAYAEKVLMFLYEQTHAHVLMLCRRASLTPQGQMQALTILLQGQLLPSQPQYSIEGSPCANVTRHGVLYFPAGVQKLFPKDAYLQHFGINSYFGAPLLDSNSNLLGIVAILHQKPLANPSLLELVLTILSPSLEALLEAHP